MGKEDKYAKRRKHLSSLMKAIFGYKSVDFCDETKDTGTIILGCKSDPMDCTFTDHYKVKYFKILEIAFTYDKYEFVFCNEKKQNKTKCDRYTIITNTIKFFKRKNIDVDYKFDSEYEKRLFFKLLYRFTLQLIESLFLFNNDAPDEIDDVCISEYNMGLCSHCKNESVEGFIEYGSNHVPFAYYSFDDHIPQLMSKKMYSRINSIKDFSFVNHKEYPVSDDRLTALNGFIQNRINRLLELYN